MDESPLKEWLEHDGSLLRLRLARPKANIIDAKMIAAMSLALGNALDSDSSSILRAVILDAEGPHFSFGASVEEHMPEQCAEMLASLHGLIKQMLDCPVPILVAISGQCLGGGLEVACGGDILFAHPKAMLGQPEIQLGVFAPAASCLLPARIGAAHAQDLLWSGRSIDGVEAHRMGLINELAEDPSAAALAWFEKYLLGGSASSIRMAVTAVQSDVIEQLKNRLDCVEKLYLQDLMNTHDAVEGLTAFVEKRAANWEHR